MPHLPNQGVSTVQMKNWLPLVFGPVGCGLRTKGKQTKRISVSRSSYASFAGHFLCRSERFGPGDGGGDGGDEITYLRWPWKGFLFLRASTQSFHLLTGHLR